MRKSIFAAAAFGAAMLSASAQGQSVEGDVALFCRQFPALQAAMVRQFEAAVDPSPSQHEAWVAFVVEVVRAGRPFDDFCASPAARAAVADRDAWQAVRADLNRRAGDLLAVCVAELRGRLDSHQSRRLMALLVADAD